MRWHSNLRMYRGSGERQFMTESQFLRFGEVSQQDRMTKRQIVYARFEAFEEQLAHCYSMLHDRFVADPPLAKFWAEAATAELQHSATLRFCRERGFMSNGEIDYQAMDHVEELLDTFKGMVANPKLTVDQAFYASLFMESSELEDTYEKLIGPLANDHRLLFDAIHAGLRSHHVAFSDAAAEFCGDRALAEAFRNLRRKCHEMHGYPHTRAQSHSAGLGGPR
jgi:hypothetical protein